MVKFLRNDKEHSVPICSFSHHFVFVVITRFQSFQKKQKKLIYVILKYEMNFF